MLTIWTCTCWPWRGRRTALGDTDNMADTNKDNCLRVSHQPSSGYQTASAKPANTTCTSDCRSGKLRTGVTIRAAGKVRYVLENAGADETIGAPLMIDDGYLPNDSQTYTPSGSDAASFDSKRGQWYRSVVTYGGQLVTYCVSWTSEEGHRVFTSKLPSTVDRRVRW